MRDVLAQAGLMNTVIMRRLVQWMLVVVCLGCIHLVPALSLGSERPCSVLIQPPDGIVQAFPIGIDGNAICKPQPSCTDEDNENNCSKPCIELTGTRYCWCDEKCDVYGDCCFRSSRDACYFSTDPHGELGGAGGGGHTVEECVRTSLYSQLKGKPLPSPDYRGHWLVIGCPAGYRNYEVETRCNSPAPSFFGLRLAGNGSDQLVHSIPVTNSLDGMWSHYKNMYCAFCRGVKLEDMIPWNLMKLQCTHSIYDPVSGAFVDVECDELVYKFRPQGQSGDLNVITQPRSCIPDMIEKCPGEDDEDTGSDKSGSWAADLCKTYEAAVLFAVDGHWYKNPHCLVCNGFLSNESNPYCYAPNAMLADRPTGTPIAIPFDFPSLADDAFDSVPLILECPDGFNYSFDTQKCVPSGEMSGISCDKTFPVVNARVYVAVDETVVGNQTWITMFLSLFVDSLSLDIKDVTNVNDNQIGNEHHHDLRVSDYSRPLSGVNHVISFDVNNISTSWERFNDLSEQMNALEDAVFNIIPALTVLGVELTEACTGNVSFDQCEITSFDAPDVVFHVVDGIPYLYHNDTPMLYHADGIILRIVYTLHNHSSHVEGVSRKIIACNAATTLLCYHIKLSGPSQYLIRDGVMQFKIDGKVYESSEYLIHPDGSAQVCQEDFQDPWFAYSLSQYIINVVGTSLSSVALVFTFVTYCMFPSLRTVPGKAIMHFVVTLFTGEILLLIGGSIPRDSTDLCTVMAAILHYIWLACFFWMTALGFDVSRTFSVRAGPRLIDGSGHALLWMCLFSWGAPAIVLIVCLPLHFVSAPGIDFNYGNNGVCWIRPEMANLLAFGVPVMASLFVNGLLFVKTIAGLRASKKITSFIEKDKSVMQRASDEFCIYLKVSVLMGLTWIWFFLAAFTGVTVLFYIAIILNAFHGVFVFVAFVCTRRVWAMWRRRLDGRGASSSRNTITGKSRTGTGANVTKTSSMATMESPVPERMGLNGTRL